MMANPVERYPEQFAEARFDYPQTWFSCSYINDVLTAFDLNRKPHSQAILNRNIAAFGEANKIIQKVMK